MKELALLLQHMRPTTLVTMFIDLTEYEPTNEELAGMVYAQLAALVGDEEAIWMLEVPSGEEQETPDAM